MHILEELKTFTEKKTITANIYWVKTYNSIMYGHFCIGFIDSILKGKSLTDFRNLFLPQNFKKKGKVFGILVTARETFFN